MNKQILISISVLFLLVLPSVSAIDWSNDSIIWNQNSTNNSINFTLNTGCPEGYAMQNLSNNVAECILVNGSSSSNITNYWTTDSNQYDLSGYKQGNYTIDTTTINSSAGILYGVYYDFLSHVDRTYPSVDWNNGLLRLWDGSNTWTSINWNNGNMYESYDSVLTMNYANRQLYSSPYGGYNSQWQIDGQLICEQNGTNCPNATGGGSSFWSGNETLIYPNNSQDVLLNASFGVGDSSLENGRRYSSKTVFESPNNASTIIANGGDGEAMVSFMSHDSLDTNGQNPYGIGISFIPFNGGIVPTIGSSKFGEYPIPLSLGGGRISSNDVPILVDSIDWDGSSHFQTGDALHSFSETPNTNTNIQLNQTSNIKPYSITGTGTSDYDSSHLIFYDDGYGDIYDSTYNYYAWLDYSSGYIYLDGNGWTMNTINYNTGGTGGDTTINGVETVNGDTTINGKVMINENTSIAGTTRMVGGILDSSNNKVIDPENDIIQQGGGSWCNIANGFCYDASAYGNHVNTYFPYRIIYDANGMDTALNYASHGVISTDGIMLAKNGFSTWSSPYTQVNGQTASITSGSWSEMDFTNGILTYHSTAYDKNLMKNITYLTNVSGLNLVSFYWNTNGLKQFVSPENHTGLQTGYTAQDVKIYYPDCVNNETEYQSMINQTYETKTLVNTTIQQVTKIIKTYVPTNDKKIIDTHNGTKKISKILYKEIDTPKIENQTISITYNVTVPLNISYSVPMGTYLNYNKECVDKYIQVSNKNALQDIQSQYNLIKSCAKYSKDWASYQKCITEV